MYNITITGSTGFVGANLIKYFSIAEDVHINALDLRSPVDEWDLVDTEVLIHLAGKAHDLKQVAQPEEYYQVNTVLCQQIYEAFLVSKAKVFIMLSSVKAVKDSFNEDTLTEDVFPNPGTIYGKSKLAAEKYILNHPPPPGKRIYILRPCMIHGPGNKGNLNLLYRFVTKGIPYPLASFKNRRSFLSVTNLCFVINEMCSRQDIPSGIYHVADDQPLSTNRVIQLMGETLRKKVRLWNIPGIIIRFLAKTGDWFQLPLNSERLGKLTENYIVSNEKLVTALQKKLPLTAEEGLRITIQSFTANP